MLGKLPNGGKKREERKTGAKRGKKRREKKNVRVKVEREKEVGVYFFNSSIVLAVRMLSSRESAPAFFNYYSRLNAPVILSAVSRRVASTLTCLHAARVFATLKKIDKLKI